MPTLLEGSVALCCCVDVLTLAWGRSQPSSSRADLPAGFPLTQAESQVCRRLLAREEAERDRKKFCLTLLNCTDLFLKRKKKKTQHENFPRSFKNRVRQGKRWRSELRRRVKLW